MLDVSRYILEIKDSNRYLFDKFLSMAQAWSCLNWQFNADLYCDTYDTEYVFFYNDIGSRERIKIQAYSEEDLFSIERADVEMVFYENENLYSVSLSIEDEDMLLELGDVVMEISENSTMYSDFCKLSRRFCYAASDPLEYAYDYIKSRIVNGKLEILLDKQSSENGRDYKKFIGITGEVIVTVTLSDSSNYSDDDTYYDDDSLILSIRNVFKFFYFQEKSKLIRDLVLKKKENEVGIEDFLVRTSVYQCINRDHHMQKIKVLVNIDNGVSINQQTAYALYCPECDQYYITETEFSRLKNKGRICCKIITIEEYKTIKSGHYDSWAKQSLLRCYGYTVNAKDNLSAKERQRILSFVIENQIMTIGRVIDFISWLEGNNKRDNCFRARQKWEEDLEYLHKYVPAKGVVIAGCFIKKKYIYE